MKRTSDEAKRLSRSLVKQGYPKATERRLERWSTDRLGPADHAPFVEKMSHYRELAKISSSGRDVDLTARRLAARGYVCSRLRTAILDPLGLVQLEPDEQVVDLEPDPRTDAGFAALEELAESIEKDPGGVQPLLVRIVKALRNNAKENATHSDRSADELFHSFVVNGLCFLMGDDIYDPDALEAVFKLDAGSVTFEVLQELNTSVRFDTKTVDLVYRTAPLDEVVFVAQRLAYFAPRVLEYLGVTRYAVAEVEDLATMFAPGAIYYVDLLREAYADFPEDPWEIDEPSNELVGSATRTEITIHAGPVPCKTLPAHDLSGDAPLLT